MKSALKHTKRVVVLVFGVTLIIIGGALLVLPGPGIVVIIASLAVLATEFVWAQSLLDKAKHHYEKTKDKITNKSNTPSAQ